MIDLSGLEKMKEGSRLYIDVGASIGAPHSAQWLARDPSAFVIGIEPSPACLEILRLGRSPIETPHLCVDLGEIRQDDYVLGHINERFIVLETAIDNVPKMTKKRFYMTDERNLGCSSLLKPTSKLPLNVVSEAMVTTIPLSVIFEEIAWEKCGGYVETLKTDTQGNDLNVLKSAGDFLEEKVKSLEVEFTTRGEYENEPPVEEFDEFMNDTTFILMNTTDTDRLYVNRALPSKLYISPKVGLMPHGEGYRWSS